MTTRRKILLSILVAVFVMEVGVYWQAKRIKNHTNNINTTLEDLDKEMEGLNKDLDKMIAEADATIESLQPLPPSTNGVASSYHEGGYEIAWIQDMDKDKGLVLVTTVDTKMVIVFKLTAGDLQKFHVGRIAPVTFQCTKLKKGKCDFNSPYKLFVSNSLVEMKQLEFPKK